VERPFSAYSGDAPYIFVSYAHDDAALVYPEISRLRDEGFNIWYDEGISPGSTWRDEVALALTQCSIFLFFITPRSVASKNCLNEVNFCLSRERKVLCVHLEKTELPIGLELSLSAMQAIIRADHASAIYDAKMAEGLKSLLPSFIEPIAIPASQSTRSEAGDKSIAILPFVNRSDDPKNDYLCDGIAEELITGLAKIDGLGLASQLSSFGLKGQNLEAKEIGVRLNVSNVLTGSVQKSGERVRISATLTESAGGRVLWSERYDGTLEDIFQLQEDVANKVIGALKVELTGIPEGSLIDSGTSNATAYQSFLLGKYEFLKSTRSGFVKAHEYFAAAVAADPQFGRAYWYDFHGWARQRGDGLIPQDDYIGPASRQIERMKLTGFEPPMPAIWIDRMLYPDRVPDEKSLARETLDKLASKDEDWGGYVFFSMGYSLAMAGLLNGSRQFHEHNIDDSALYAQGVYGNLLFALGRFEKAIEHFSDIIVKEPHDVQTLGSRAMLYSRTGQYAKADADLAELAKTFPRNFAQFYHLYWRRDLDAARAYFDWLDGQRNLVPVLKIWGCFLLGYIDKGMDYIEQAKWGAAMLPVFALYPLTSSMKREVRAHPKYKAILAREGMDDAWRDELMTRVNELESITGIRVALDEDY
jgi:TolB-like protein